MSTGGLAALEPGRPGFLPQADPLPRNVPALGSAASSNAIRNIAPDVYCLYAIFFWMREVVTLEEEGLI
jgi:hypothetical protein